ncbi:MAG: hypothetical protein WCJ30_16550 [Deltaproteobacteria bacterium]
MHRSLSLLLLSTAVALCATACGSPSFSQEIQPILNQSCAVGGSSCHSATGTGGRLRLDPASAYAALVGVASTQVPSMRMVEAGHASASFLLNKITGDMYTAVPACSSSTMNCGTRMPMLGGQTLTDAQVALIRQWINAGAPNN